MTIAGALTLAIDLVESPARGWLLMIVPSGLFGGFLGLKTLERIQRLEVRCTGFC